MSEFFSVLWTIVSFLLGIVWWFVWFILRDLISTLLWIGIVVWVGFALRYRSFTEGTLAMLRYGRKGVLLLWRWVRGKPGESALASMASAAEPITKIVTEYKERVPLGYMPVSGQLNALLLFLLVLLANR
ncbi:MAG: hypothetical protein P8Y67_05570 [Alphaproteobacteria bacterium]